MALHTARKVVGGYIPDASGETAVKLEYSACETDDQTLCSQELAQTLPPPPKKQQPDPPFQRGNTGSATFAVAAPRPIQTSLVSVTRGCFLGFHSLVN
jgi:hypothetical protein